MTNAASSPSQPSIVERLRAQAHDATDWHGETMKEWDKIRGIVETHKGSDLPRLMFEGLIESLAELMTEGADEIASLKARVEELEKALRFYADDRRYQGANQRPIPDDPYAKPDAVYINDVTRDLGAIARAALPQSSGVAR